jgi:hypothetical protein
MFQRLMLGNPWANDSQASGVYDFDDVRLSTTPMATQLTITPDPNTVVTNCIRLSVGLRDVVSEAAAPAPYDVTVALGVTGGSGTFYSDSDCKTATQTAQLPAQSETGVLASFRPSSAGAITLTATSVDFLSGETKLFISPSQELPRTLSLSCAMGALELPLCALLLPPFLLRRRRG